MFCNEDFQAACPIGKSAAEAGVCFSNDAHTGALPHLLTLLTQYCGGESSAVIQALPNETTVLFRDAASAGNYSIEGNCVPFETLCESKKHGRPFGHRDLVGICLEADLPGGLIALVCRRAAEQPLEPSTLTTLTLLAKVATRILSLRKEIALTGNQLEKQVALTSKLESALKRDYLTGLANRAGLRAELEDRIAQRKPCALLLFDLDEFKFLNDSYGHDVGDAVLRHVADCLSEGVRRETVVSRIGGDEFAMLLPDVKDHEALFERATSLCASARKPFFVEGRKIVCNISAGGCLFPSDADTVEGLYRNADTTLRLAKRSGGVGVRVFDSEARTVIATERQTKRIVERAVQDRKVIPHYQPQLDPRTGHLLGVEVLARIRDPQGNLLSPDAFSGAFHRLELARPLRAEMMRQVREDLAWLARDGIDPGRIAINVSCAEIMDPELGKLLDEIGLPPEKIEIEITEDVMLGRSGQRIRSVVEKLRESGVRIALDDFGTGFASLTHLSSYPIDTIKTDRSFVRSIGHERSGGAIIKAVMQLGRDLGLQVVVEGIEESSQLQFVLQNGCTAVQGMLLAPPLAAEDLADFLKTRMEAAA